jgi:DNA excision repair protein ERCC-6
MCKLICKKTICSLFVCFATLEGEAEKLAQNAIEALRRSRTFYEGVSRYGSNTDSRFAAKSTPEKPRFGKKNAKLLPSKTAEADASSSAILAKAEERNKFNNLFGRETSNGDGGDPPDMPDVPEELKDLVDDVRTFLAFGARESGRASTKEIIEKFRDRLPSKKSPVFKALLNKLCDFHKSNGEGTWTLKREFC